MLSIAFVVFYFVIEGSSKYDDFSSLPVWLITSRAALSGITIYFGFLRKKPFPLLFKICFAFLAAYPWIMLAFPEGKLMFAVNFLLFALVVFTEVSCGAKGNFFYLIIPFFWALYASAMQLNRISLNLANIKYIIIAGVLALILTVLLDHLREKEIVFPYFGDTRKPYILYLFGMIFSVIFALLFTLNYCLDFSEGISHTCVINDKTSDEGGRIRYYNFVVDYNGEETSLSVNWDDYSAFEIGDTITVTHYDGFLGDEYIIVNE